MSKDVDLFAQASRDVMELIAPALIQRLYEARCKHPTYAEGKYNALGVVADEFKEFERAVEHETVRRQFDEALDVTATCSRFILGEHEKD